MQQLTLQFEGLAPMGTAIDAKAPAREVRVKKNGKAACEAVCEALSVLSKSMRKARAWIVAHRETAEDALECAAFMGAGTFVLYMAAVLQGGGV